MTSPALRQAVRLYLVVAAGAAIGGTARALVSLAVLRLAGPGFPWGTLAANVLGSFLIGLYATLTEPGGRLMAGPRMRQFVLTGIFGGFTTFSLFSLETLRLFEAGARALAAANVGVSVLAWMLAVWAGAALGQRMNRLPGADGR